MSWRVQAQTLCRWPRGFDSGKNLVRLFRVVAARVLNFTRPAVRRVSPFLLPEKYRIQM